MRHPLVEPLEPRQLLSGSAGSAHIGEESGIEATGVVMPATAAQPVLQGAAVTSDVTSDHVDAAAVRDGLIRFVDTWNGGQLGKLGTGGMGTYSASWDGLFRMNLDRQFNPVNNSFTNDMSIISQSRGIYMNVEAYRNAPAAERARFKAAVQRGADNLLAKAVDPNLYDG